MVVVITGLRLGEAFGLRWQDVDLSAKRLHVRHSLEVLNGNHRPKEPKSEKSRRTVELPALAVDALREHQKQQLADGFFSPDKPVFADTDGGCLRNSNFTLNVYGPTNRRRNCCDRHSTDCATSTRAIRSNSGRA